MQQRSPIIYTAESQLSSPRKLLHSMLLDLKSSPDLAWQLTVRDISARYRQSFLGILWAFITPLTATLLFVFLEKEGIINRPTDGNISYPTYVFMGTMLWQLFADSVNAPLALITKNKTMLSKLNFPREALLLSALLQIFFDLGIKLLGLSAVLILTKVTVVWWAILPTFGISLGLLLMGFTLGTFLTPIGILYTDVTTALRTVLALWFFITPAAYKVSGHGWYATLMTYNPVSPLLSGARTLLLRGTCPEAPQILIILTLTSAMLFFAWLFYRVSIPVLTERMG